MTKKKVPKRTYVAEIDLKTTFAELVPAKKKGRPPKQVGQGRNRKHIRLHDVTQDELKKRLDAAVKILETGKLPVGKKEDTPPPPPKGLSDKEKLHNYLNTHGVKFNRQLGISKLQELVQEHKDKVGDPTKLPGHDGPPEK